MEEERSASTPSLQVKLNQIESALHEHEDVLKILYGKLLPLMLPEEKDDEARVEARVEENQDMDAPVLMLLQKDIRQICFQTCFVREMIRRLVV